MRHILSLLLLLVLSFSSSLPAQSPAPSHSQSTATGLALPETFNTFVISVTDGNWFETEREGRHISVRLYGTLCPDRKTPVGAAAAQDLGRLIYGKTVHVKRVGYSPYGGILGIVTVDNYINGQTKTSQVNESMISRGWALAQNLLDLSGINARYASLENEARIKGVGIWFRPGATVQPK